MKKIIYKNLKIKDFLSVGKDAIQINFKKGLNQIDGINSDVPDRKNGVGKSVICSSFFFALFGETINKIKSDFVVNNVTKGKGLIELEFDVETSLGTKSYKIKRQVKPSKVELWEGVTDITKSTIAETNKYICDLLSTNPAIHRCCDVMTVRDTTPFMEMDAKDKKAFIESIFSIDVFGVMLKDLKKMITEAKKDKDVSSAKVSEIERSLKSLIDQKEIIKKQIEERDEILQKRRDDLDVRIQCATDEIETYQLVDLTKVESNLKKLESAIYDIDSKIGECHMSITTNKHFIGGIKDKLKNMSDIKSGVKCEKCLQDIDHTHTELIEAEKESANIFLKNYEDALVELHKELVKNRETKNKLVSKQTQIQRSLEEAKTDILKKQNLEKNLEQLLESKKDLDDDMNISNLSIASFDANIDSTSERLDEESGNLSELQQKLSDYDICKFILGEEGVKSFVVKKLLDLLNNTIEKYLIDLGLSVRVKFDEYFEEVITSGGKLFSYKNASGAEKKSLDFACCFAFSDMRKKINQVTSNVEFLDEALDSAVDSAGIDLILKVIKDRIDKNDTCVYLISHRKEVKDKIDGEIIMLEKSGNITRRITK